MARIFDNIENDLLTMTESRTLDFKRISAKHGPMIETSCAFVNPVNFEERVT